MTKEERREYMKAYYKANRNKMKEYASSYRESNKDKIKAYREANKEKNKAYYRDYFIANKAKRKEYDKAYYEANKDRIKARKETYHKSKKHKPTVYLLENENYVGTTENLEYRMRFHKHNGRDVSEVRILGEFDSRSDALEVEALIHDLGYKGQHSYNVYK